MQAGRVTGVHTDQGFIAADMVINAAGPWAAEVAGWAGIDLPLRNRARTILVTGPLPAMPRDHPFVEDVATELVLPPGGGRRADGHGAGAGGQPGASGHRSGAGGRHDRRGYASRAGCWAAHRSSPPGPACAR